MKRQKKPIALLASCMMLTNGICADMPHGMQDTAKTTELLPFAEQLTQEAPAFQQGERFSMLRFSAGEQLLYRDGKPVGQSCAGCRIENGALVISANGGDALTPEEAAERIGCRVLSEENGDLSVTFPFQTARLIVKAKQVPALHGGRLLASGFRDLYVIQYDSQEAAYRAYQAYQQNPDIVFTDCDSVLSAADMPDSSTNALDSERTSWGVHDIGADDYCAWLTAEKETLPEICVAVVDTGVNASHTWLEGRILPNGARFSEDAPGGWEDDFGHGTHCAGIIASCTMDNVKILPIKVLNREGMGTTLEIYCGVMYALEQGADVISMSLGGLGVSPLLNDAAASAAEQDVTFCVAAGNDSLDTKYGNAVNAPDVIGVAALDEDHQVAAFSNRGPAIDFAAPGVKILSAISDSTDATMLSDGTSMATPFVAAAASDLLSYDPSLTAKQIYDYLRANALDLGEPGYDAHYGWGEVSLRDFRFQDKHCPVPVFSPESGEYDEAQEITLSYPDDGGDAPAVYYTLDGTEPDPAHAKLYTGEPFLLEQSAAVKAIAVRDGVQSRTASASYCIGDADTADAFEIRDGVLLAYHGTRQRLYLDELFADGSLKAIGEGAFAENCVLTDVALPDSVTEIGARAFAGCEKLRNVTACGVKSVGREAFVRCTTLQEAEFDALDTLGAGAFRNCGSFMVLRGGLSDACTEIPDYAFCGCGGFPFSGTLQVTKIGAYAFSGIAAEGNAVSPESLSWEKLEVIGAHAFESAGVNGAVHLDALRSVGEYAFFVNRLTELRLPDSVTVLPEGVLRESPDLRVLTAKGVTSVGAGALQRSEQQQMLAELDFDHMTEIGSCAFDGVSFVHPVTFPKLKTIGKGALDGIAGACFRFPAVQTLETGAIRRAEHAQMLCFENLVSAEFEAVQNAGAVVVGDAFRHPASGSVRAELLAGPADSPLKAYAAQLQIPYQANPSLVKGDTELYTDNLTPAALTAFPAGFGDLHVKWFDADGTLLRDDASGTYYAYSEQAGTFRYRAVLYDGTAEAEAADFTVHVLTSNECGVVTVHKDEPAYIDWRDAVENGTAVRQAGFQVMALLRFQPEADGVYTLLKSGGRSAVRIDLPDWMQVFEQLNAVEPARIPFYAEKGYTYMIRVWTTEDAVASDAFDSLQICSGGAAGVKILREDRVKAEWADMPKHGLQAAGKPLEPEFAAVTDEADGTVLQKGKDYVVRYRYHENPGSAEAWIIGIGDYCGIICENFSIAGVIREGERVRSGASSLFSQTDYFFTPEADGDYTVYLDYTDEWIEKQTAYSCFRLFDWFPNRGLTVYELTPDGRNVRMADADEMPAQMLPGVTLTMKQGVTYMISFDDFAVSEAELELCVRRDAEMISAFLPELPDEPARIPLTDGAAKPEPEWTQPLRAGTDYTVQYFGNERCGTMAAVFRGTGDICGTACLQYRVTEDLPQSGTVPVMHANGGSAEFRFVPETDGTYRFYTDYSAEEIDAVLEKQTFDPDRFYEFGSASLVTELEIRNAEGEPIETESDAHMGLALVSAELEAGETYYVFVRAISNKDVETYVLGVEHEWLPLADATAYFDETVYSGDPEPPAPRLWYGAVQLKEGTDYTVVQPESTRPGYRMFLISGCGRYFGHLYCVSEVRDGISGVQELQLNVPFTQNYSEVTYTFVLEKPASLRLRPADGEKENYSVLLTRELEPGERYLDIRQQTVKLVPDRYHLRLTQNAGTQRSYVLEIMREQTDITACEIVTQNAVFTGQPVTPSVRVTDRGKLLTEGSDYFVSCQQTLEETGQYILYITGNGSYCGTASVSMCILPEDLSALPLLTDGAYTAEIKEPAQTVLYRWSPGTESCIVSDAYMDKQFSVSQGDAVLAQTGGIGSHRLTPETEPGETCIVAVSLRNPDETGIIRFSVHSGFRELSRCTADIPALVPADQAGTVPAFTVRDGDTVLKEGTDYTVFTVGGQDRIGTAEIVLRGAGAYVGEMVLHYIRYPETPEAFVRAEKDDGGEYEIKTLVPEEPARLIYALPGTPSLFRFRAETDGTYYFTLPEQHAAAVVYLPDGTVLPADQYAAALSAGDECLILTVSGWVNPEYGAYDTFEVGVSRSAPAGDVNGDGRTDADDARLLMRWLGEQSGTQLNNPDAADCNADGITDMLDVQAILQRISG